MTAGARTADERLADFVAELTYEDIPREVVGHAKLCLLDAIGCGLFGSSLPWSKTLVQVLTEHGASEEASIWGTRQRASLPDAALANGTMIHGFELDDLHRASILHPGSVVVSAALAVSEGQPGTTGRDVITAMVAGYEVGARVGMAAGTSHLRRGFHPTGTHGAAAAAAAAASLLGLDAAKTADAISIGATQAAGLMASQYGSMVKRLHAGRAAQSGVYGALLAARGFTGIRDVFESRYGGYLSTLSDAPDFSALTAGLGRTWETGEVGFKWHAACGSCHTGIDAALALRDRIAGGPSSIVRIDVRCSSATAEHVGWPYHPGTATTAQMNLGYCMAVALLDGEVQVAQFAGERLVAPDVLALSHAVQVAADPSIDALGPAGRHEVRVRVETAGGPAHELVVRHAKGSRERALRHDEVLEKFHALASGVVGDEVATRIRDHVLTFEHASACELPPLLAAR